LAKKCILHRFLGPPPKSRLQKARHQLFANEAKKRHLYDTIGFSEEGTFGWLVHNLLKSNLFSAKIAAFQALQNHVKKNACL
jgi:hypothetical protein